MRRFRLKLVFFPVWMIQTFGFTPLKAVGNRGNWLKGERQVEQPPQLCTDGTGWAGFEVEVF